MSVFVRFLVCLLLLSAPSTVFAEDDHGEEGAHNHVVALRTIGVLAIEADEEPALLIGPGVLIERAVIHHQLEIELSMALLFGKGEALPVDLLIKKPFHFSEMLDLYVGAGPVVVFVFPEDDVTSIHPGGIASFGSYVWLWGDVGVQMELDYAVVFEEHVLQEFETALGIVYRF